ncbi:uncharacterized protein LOC110653965 [Hevea brasiliensis]|uniref:uncharacterized protein LOC110653965 n=1 Tax=Hevea brasiliensis TaxID=3981 RepID=UPI0025E2DEA6|nr:uncharacterized protein LOC110653965 [Hevea brasiliensis]
MGFRLRLEVLLGIMRVFLCLAMARYQLLVIDSNTAAQRCSTNQPLNVFCLDFAKLPKKDPFCEILFGISDLELNNLDTLEDVEYERTNVDVSLKDGSHKLQAHTYVWGNKNDPYLFGEWDLEVKFQTFLFYCGKQTCFT